MFVAQASGAPADTEADADTGGVSGVAHPVTAEEIWDFIAHGITKE